MKKHRRHGSKYPLTITRIFSVGTYQYPTLRLGLIRHRMNCVSSFTVWPLRRKSGLIPDISWTRRQADKWVTVNDINIVNFMLNTDELGYNVMKGHFVSLNPRSITLRFMTN